MKADVNKEIVSERVQVDNSGKTTSFRMATIRPEPSEFDQHSPRRPIGIPVPGWGSITIPVD